MRHRAGYFGRENLGIELGQLVPQFGFARFELSDRVGELNLLSHPHRPGIPLLTLFICSVPSIPGSGTIPSAGLIAPFRKLNSFAFKSSISLSLARIKAFSDDATIFCLALVSTIEHRSANLSVSRVSAQCCSSADIVQMTQMLESPPSAFSRRCVSFESR